jgi:NitT/TauT family transport system permease protein
VPPVGDDRMKKRAAPGKALITRVLRRLAVPAGIFAVCLLVWQLICVSTEPPAWKLPSPTRVAEYLVNNRVLVLKYGWQTFYKTCLALGAGILFSVGLALIVFCVPRLRRVVEGSLVVFKVIPLLAFAPYIIIAFGNGAIGHILMAAALSFFPLALTLLEGISRVSVEDRDLMYVLGASRWQIIKKVVIGRTVPFFFVGLKTAATLSLVGAIIAEMFNPSNGLGYGIFTSAVNTYTDQLLGLVIVAAAMGMMIYLMIEILRKIICWWEDPKLIAFKRAFEGRRRTNTPPNTACEA